MGRIICVAEKRFADRTRWLLPGATPVVRKPGDGAGPEPGPTSALPNDSKSLQAYLTVALRAYQVRDVDTFNQLIYKLVLPDADRHFNEWIGPDKDPSMKENYNRRYVAFRSRLVENFAWAERSGATLTLEPQEKVPAEESAASSPALKVDLRIERVKYVLVAQGKGRREWMDCFVLADGGLRFIGQEGIPFWSKGQTEKVTKPQ